MHKKSLIETNPYLKDPVEREKLFYTAVSSSTAVEGVHVAMAKAIKASDELNKTFTLVTSEFEASGKSRK